MTTICNPAINLNQIVQLQKAARNYETSRDYEEAQRSYLRLVEVHPDRKDFYLERAEDCRKLI